MSYIGNTVTTQGFTAAVDFFSGNGSTTAFTLSRPVASVAQVQAVISNVPQIPGVAFTVSGNTITFTSAPPTASNNIYVYYTSPITQVIQPSQGTVGAAQMQSGAAAGNLGYTPLNPANNLSDVSTVATARTNLGLGTVATLNSVGVTNLSATGTASSTTYLRGDNTWGTPAGGVTSMNGQTGAVTNTNLYDIGSFITGRPANYTNYAINSTLAGSSLYNTPPGCGYVSGTSFAVPYWNTTVAGTLVNTGSWRCVSNAWGDNSAQSSSGVWVRYA
mgnify:CR=1 FL=1